MSAGADLGAAEALRHPRLARLSLLALVGYCVLIGIVAAAAPRTFYDDFPFLAHWVERLPPYNEHLVTDVGGLYLGFAVFIAWAAWKPRREIVLAAAVAFLTVSVPHLIFHLTHLGGFGTVDGAGEIAALASLLVPPCLAIWAVGEPHRPATAD